MASSRAAERSRRRERARATQAATRRRRLDVWAVTASAAVIALLLAFLLFAAPLPGDMGWSGPVVMLCLVVAAGVGRALIGYRGAEEQTAKRRAPGEALLLASLAAAAILPYLPTLFVGFLSDDYALAGALGGIRDPVRMFAETTFPLLYRPLHVLVWWGTAETLHRGPLVYHALSLLMHALNSVLVYILGKRYAGSTAAAWLAGLLFAVHPLHVEAVAWASGQVDLQCALLSLLSLLFFEYHLSGKTAGRRAAWLVAALAAFFLALLTKEAALALPGVAVLRMLLATLRSGGTTFLRSTSASEERSWRRLAEVIGGFGVVLIGYFALRVHGLGGLGGYLTRPSFWNTAFPSAPLMQMEGFLFPVNQPLLHSWAGPWLGYGLVLLMVTAAVWWVRGLAAVQWQRIVFLIGYLVVMAVPVWLLPLPGRDLEYSRYAYLPTIGLAWLFGAIAAGRAASRLRSGVLFAVLAAAAVLSALYVAPWLQARRLADRVVAQGVEATAELPVAGGPPAVYLQNLADTHLGAQVFRNGYDVALAGRLQGRARVYQWRGSADVLSYSTLFPGEYVLAWQGPDKGFKVIRSGTDRRVSEAQP